MADPRQIYSGLLSRGISPIGAVGLLANFQAESGLNPGINEINPVVEGSRGGFGLSQWTGPRRRQFEDFARQRGASLDDLDTQLDFTAWELRNTEKRAGEALRSAQTPEEAARIVSDKFLRPGIPHMDKRLAAAQQFSSLLGGNYIPPPVEQMQPVNGGSTMQQGLLEMIQKEDTRTLGEKLKASAKDGSLFDALALGFNTMRGPMADQGLAQSVGARIEGRQEQARQNQTAEWLAANGRPDLAEALTSGMIDGETAFAAMQPQEQQLMNAGDGRLYNQATGEWIMAPDSGQQELPSAVQALQWRAQEAGLQPGTPEYAQFIIDGGRSDGFAIDVDPATGSVSVRQGSGAGASAKPFTEGQSKDNVYATRAEGALTALDPIAGTLTSRSERAAEMVPFGLARGVQSDEFQVAQNAGDEFLQAILRKDTGAAITEQEQMLYGKTYLPQPGDSEAVMAQKQQARRRAVEAIKSGMSPAQMIAQEKALAASGSQELAPIDQPAPTAAQPDFSTMNDAELDAWIAQNGG